MKKYPTLCLLLALLFFLSGCTISLPTLFSRSDQQSQTETVSIYRVAADRTALDADLISAQEYPVTEDALQEPETLLELFSAPTQSETLVCALPDGVSVESWTLENGLLTMTLSPAFLDAADMEQTITAFCAALTMCQIDGVEAITLISDGQTLFSGLAPADALLNDTDTDPYVRQLRLYFADGDGRYLVSEYHSLTLDEDTSPERYVVEELLRGPNNGELQSALPSGTTLLSCTTVDGLCTVDLSQEFYDNRPTTALGERLAIYSLVDSLTALSVVDQVSILVAGQPLDTYVYCSLAQPLTWYGEAVGPVSTAKGEFDADLYLVLPGGETIAALPFRITETDYESRTEAVLTTLLNSAEPGYPALFSGSTSVTDVILQGSVCTIDLSESFFASLPEQARSAAIQSIAATLCGLSEIDTVRFTMGGQDVILDGVDWSGPWRTFDEIKEK
jgi:germination protein M